MGAGCGGSLSTGDPSAASRDAGTAVIDARVTVVLGGPYACPGISSFAIDTAELPPGHVAHLRALTVGSAPSFIDWTVSPETGGRFSSTSSPDPVFECARPGVVTVAVQVGIVVPGRANVCDGVANTSYAGTIRCLD